MVLREDPPGALVRTLAHVLAARRHDQLFVRNQPSSFSHESPRTTEAPGGHFAEAFLAMRAVMAVIAAWLVS
jgi:hypothetical protein